MSYLLDTNACIRILDGSSSRLVQALQKRSAGEVRLCSVVKAELLFGARKSLRSSENLKLLDDFFAPFESLPFDDRCAERYGSVRAELERTGRPIGPNDLLIASIALVHGDVLVTHNLAEFSRVPGLRLEDWER